MSRNQNGIPNNVGTAPPPPHSSTDNTKSWTIEAISQLTSSNGVLEGTVSAMKDSIDKQDTRFTQLEKTVSRATHVIYGASCVVIVLSVIGGFIVNKSWDLMVHYITAPQIQSSQTMDNSKNP